MVLHGTARWPMFSAMKIVGFSSHDIQNHSFFLFLIVLKTKSYERFCIGPWAMAKVSTQASSIFSRRNSSSSRQRSSSGETTVVAVAVAILATPVVRTMRAAACSYATAINKWYHVFQSRRTLEVLRRFCRFGYLELFLCFVL